MIILQNNQMKKEFNVTEWVLKNRLNEGKEELQFPEGFQPAKSVPQGGAMCANCAKWNKKKQLCDGQYYINWNGNGEIPAEPTEYVCIWWVNKEK
jgi:hypothetical protein